MVYNIIYSRKHVQVTMLSNHVYVEKDVLFSNDTGKLGKRNSEFFQQEPNL